MLTTARPKIARAQSGIILGLVEGEFRTEFIELGAPARDQSWFRATSSLWGFQAGKSEGSGGVKGASQIAGCGVELGGRRRTGGRRGYARWTRGKM
jgi:hypothetical protein